MPQVTVVGYGAMGSGMAKRLVTCNSPSHSVNVFDVRPAAVAAFQQFQHDYDPSNNPPPDSTLPPKSLSLTVDGSDIIIVCVLNDEQCDSVIKDIVPFFGDGDDGEIDEDESLTTPSPAFEQVVSIVITATVPPSYISKLPSRINSAYKRRVASGTPGKRFEIIDSPISGGPIRSEEGSLTIMASAPPSHLNRVKPTLDILSNANTSGSLVICGEVVGQGMTVKIIHQLIAGCNLVSAAEGYTLASKMGVLNEAFKSVCSGGAARLVQARSDYIIKRCAHSYVVFFARVSRSAMITNYPPFLLPLLCSICPAKLCNDGASG